MYLIGFRDRLNVLINRAQQYLRRPSDVPAPSLAHK